MVLTILKLEDLAKELQVTPTRVKQLCNVLSIEPQRVEGRLCILAADREKIMAYRQRPKFTGYVSTLDLMRKLDVSYDTLQRYLTQLDIIPSELYEGYLYVSAKQSQAIRRYHHHGKLPAETDFERRVTKAVSEVWKRLEPELHGLKTYVDEELAKTQADLNDCKALLLQVQHDVYATDNATE